MGGRAEVGTRAVALRRAGTAVAVVGEHGSGRTWILDHLALDGGRPRSATALALDEGDGLDVLSEALGERVPADPAVVASLVGDDVLAIEDVQWLGPAGWNLLLELIGRVPVVVSLAVEHADGRSRQIELEQRGAEVLALDPMDEVEARALLASVGRVEPGEVEAALRWAGGNPALLLAPPDRPLPAAVAAGVDARLDRLGPDGSRAVAALHLAAGPVPRPLLGPSDPDAAADLDRALTAAAAAGWIAVDPSLGMRLVQGALGPAAVERLDPGEVEGVHEALARLDDHRAAHHLEQLGRTAEALASARRFLPDATGPELVALLELVVRCGPPDEAPAVDRQLAAALLAAGRPGDAEAPARRAGDAAALAAALRQRGRAGAALGVVVDAGPSGASGASGPWLAREADRLARWPAIGSGAGAAASLVPVDQLGDAERHDERAARGAVDAVRALVVADHERAARAVVEARTRLASAPTGPWHHLLDVVDAAIALHRGDAPAAIAEVLGPLAALEHPAVSAAASQVALALADVGRADEALEVVAAARRADLEAGLEPQLLSLAAAEVELIAGRPRRAVRALPDPEPTSGFAVATIGLLIEGWAAVDTGRPVDLSRRPPEVGGAPDLVSRAFVAELEGLALLAEDPLGAAAAFEEAAEQWPSARWARRSRWAAAESRRLAGELEPAIVGLRVLEAEAAELGLLPLLARVRQSLRRAGVQDRRSTGRRASGSSGLSGREHQVMELLAQGLTSAAAAEQLQVGRATVESQIASAMRKLGARNRVQAVALHRAREAS